MDTAVSIEARDRRWTLRQAIFQSGMKLYLTTDGKKQKQMPISVAFKRIR